MTHLLPVLSAKLRPFHKIPTANRSKFRNADCFLKDLVHKGSCIFWNHRKRPHGPICLMCLGGPNGLVGQIIIISFFKAFYEYDFQPKFKIEVAEASKYKNYA
ncbi:hypothetical protein CEXT_317701 [Caerostris extrusa]|uniref:Uncharacterized protein n=1 Tax=Caerostris extrusa TaxID=172846 RepID=A0AAV4MXX0_CAEEX|nr:hypothetical protein CEXT_317701 [Caerostris extrusa]